MHIAVGEMYSLSHPEILNTQFVIASSLSLTFKGCGGRQCGYGILDFRKSGPPNFEMHTGTENVLLVILYCIRVYH